MSNADKPRVPVCFWCGLPKDTSFDEFPKGSQPVVSDYDPCDRCEEEYSKGIQLIGVTEDKPIIKGMFPIVQDDEKSLYPTGSTMLVSEEYIKEILEGKDEEIDIVLKRRKMMIPEDILKAIIEKVRKLDEEGVD